MKKHLLTCLLFLITSAAIVRAQVIASFSPASGPIGTLVTISGTNLNGATSLSIGGATAIIISNNGTQLLGMVMPNAITGPVSIKTSGANVTSTTNFSILPTAYPIGVQSNKMVAVGTSGQEDQGIAVAISADGNTAIVGGTIDNNLQGACWIYVRNNGLWSQQGNKLIGSDPGKPQFGNAVAISADGNTVLVGSAAANESEGGVYVFVRNGTTWTQQSSKLLGTGATSLSQEQGSSVALSADGNTAAVGGDYDNNNQGAVWIFTRTGTTWTQAGNKLSPSGAVGSSAMGISIALSADGNTLIAGGEFDNNFIGAAWVFVKNGSTWSQQGPKLVATDAVGTDVSQGTGVAISADGNTAIVGGWSDNSNIGAAWIYTRNNGIWKQASKLVAKSKLATYEEGIAVAISGDGSTAVVGEPYHNVAQGAAWVFTKNGTNWVQNGFQLTAASSFADGLQGHALSLTADGTTLISGAFTDNGYLGASWVFTSAPLPLVTTQAATNISPFTATLNGIGNDNGINTTVSFEYSTAPDLSGSTTVVPATGISPITAGKGDVNFTYNLTGLTALTTYYYRLNGDNGKGTTKGNILSFTTLTSAPSISSFTPTAALSGATVTITGVNFTGATAVNFGTTPAASFNVVSSTTITAVVGAGSSGNITVITPTGTAVSTQNFSLVLKPVITSFTPTTGKQGTTITITGANFTGATAVSLSGQPAASFTVVSSTTITAAIGNSFNNTGIVSVTTPIGGTATLSGLNYVPYSTVAANGPTTFNAGGNVLLTLYLIQGPYTYQWLKDGVPINGATSLTYIATQSGTYGASVSLNNVTQLSSAIPVTVVYALPASNFNITVTGATCHGSTNGTIAITAAQNLNYTATISGTLNVSYPFTTSTTINNLPAGLYTLCFTVAGQSAYSQCFTVLVTEPKDLSVYTAVNNTIQSLSLILDGGNTYFITLNGVTTTTTASNITLALNKGINDLTVTTDKLCQGVIKKRIDLSTDVLAYPNPFTSTLNINVGTDNLPSATIGLYNTAGVKVYSKQFSNVSGEVQLTPGNLAPGIYVLKLSAGQLERVFKVVKQ